MPLLASPQLSFVACSVPLGRLLLRTCVRVGPSSVALAWTSARCMRRRRAEVVPGTASQHDDRCNLQAAMPCTPATCATVGVGDLNVLRRPVPRCFSLFHSTCRSPHAKGLTRCRAAPASSPPMPRSQFGSLALQMFQTSRTNDPIQADGSTAVCSASSCQEPFGFFQRRHHCRKCGGIFCWQHSSQQVRLDELARFHPDGELHRACDRCHGSFREWEHLRSSRSNSESSNSSAAAIQIEALPPAKRPENARVGSIVGSIQGAWNWSTF